MRIYLLAGEHSGDIHGAALIRAIRQRYQQVELRAMGGDQMQQAGASLAFHYQDFAIMGFVEVIQNLRKIKARFKAVEADIRAFKPDRIICIDFPGFNLRLAKRLYPDFELHYYIAPKAWAWKKDRAKQLAKQFKTVSCILPFELDFFESYGCRAQYVGNPSQNQVATFLQQQPPDPNAKPYIAIFPGSRQQEIERILPTMLAAIRSMNLNYKISKAANLDLELYIPYLQDKEDLIEDNYLLLRDAHAALVCSGTATLETALLNIPQVVCYKANPSSYWIAKRLVQLKYISLVNLIMNREVVRELIQEACTSEQIQAELSKVLQADNRQSMKHDYQLMQKKLGSHQAAEAAVEFIDAHSNTKN